MSNAEHSKPLKMAATAEAYPTSNGAVPCNPMPPTRVWCHRGQNHPGGPPEGDPSQTLGREALADLPQLRPPGARWSALLELFRRRAARALES
jgi:hypothetical protein